jgi:hypothetical protein
MIISDSPFLVRDAKIMQHRKTIYLDYSILSLILQINYQENLHLNIKSLIKFLIWKHIKVPCR